MSTGRVGSSPGLLPQPGQEVRWRHPRLAFALGWFNAYGPGPFVVVGAREGDADGPLTLVVQSEYGQRGIEAVRLGPVSLSLPPTPPVADGKASRAEPPSLVRT